MPVGRSDFDPICCWTVGDEDELAGHVFLSYVREDGPAVDDLQRVLQAAGVRVWRDTENLWPGRDWRSEIRQAISDDALVFIACFSRNSAEREKSYQNEEITLAIEQLRLRPPDRSWLIPARLDDCVIPDRDIGGGRTLASIQRVDLFGERYGPGIGRLVAAVLRVLGLQARPAAAPAQLGPAVSVDSPQESTAEDQRIDVSPVGSGSRSRQADEWIRALARKQHVLKPATTDRWRLTYTFADVPAMSQLASHGFDHHGYSCPAEKTPAWMRIRAVVACDLLDETLGWQDLRAKFAGFLTQESVRGLIDALTDIPDGATWRHRATARRSWLEADMTVTEETVVPSASAKLFLPENESLAGLQPGCAQLTLHIDLPQRGQSGIAARGGFPPPFWRRRFEQALAMPGELAAWLEKDLGLASVERPAPRAGILLHSTQPLTELIDSSGIPVLPGPVIQSQFSGWAVADTDGKNVQDLASQMMLDLSERVLHLDGTAEQMSGLA